MSEQRPQPPAAAEEADRDPAPGTEARASEAAGEAAADRPWSLAAGVPGLPGDVAKAAYEGLRELSPDEFTAVSAARDLLSLLTVSSPHQHLVQRYEVLAEALDEVAGDSLEGRDARLARAQVALRSWARQATGLPVSVQDAYGQLLRDRAMTALGNWRGGELHQVCAALAEGGQVALTPQGEAAAVLPAASPDDRPRVIPVHGLLAAVLSGSERLHFHVLLDAEPELHEASRLLRALEGEVLLGAPLLMRMAGTQLQLQELHAAVRTIAETAVRAARRALVAPASAGGEGAAPAAPSLPPGRAAEPADETGTEGAAEPAAEPTEEPAQVPPVDVAAVARLLSASVSRLELVWAEAVAPDQALLAAEVDRDRFSGVAAALLRQSEEFERDLRGSGTGVIPHFPLTPGELTALDPQRPSAPGPHACFLPQLYVLQEFLRELQSLTQPRSLTLGPGGAVTRIAFDPAAVGRLKAQAELLGRCARFLDLAQQRPEPDGASSDAAIGAELVASIPDAAELAWLGGAVRRAFDAGLPEAVVLYSQLLVGSSATGAGDFDDVVRRLCRHLASGANAADALPVIVPLAHHLVASLAGGGIEGDPGDLTFANNTEAAAAGDAPTEPAQP